MVMIYPFNLPKITTYTFIQQSGKGDMQFIKNTKRLELGIHNRSILYIMN